MKLCAICTRETLAPRMEPLGRGGALVPVCRICNQESPRSGRYAFAGGARSLKPARSTSSGKGGAP